MRSIRPLRSGWYLHEADAAAPLDAPALARPLLASRPDALAAAGWLPTTVPALVHDVLAAQGLLPDPRSPGSDDALRRASERDWLFATTFPTPATAGGPIVLRFRSVDTLATVTLNGEPLGSFASLFCEHAVDVSGRLAPTGQRNVLLVHLRSPLAWLAEQDVPPGVPAHHLLRKAEAQFAPAYGARAGLVPSGIPGDVLLDVRDRAWIDDVSVRTELAPDHSSATLRVQADVSRRQAWLHWSLADPSGAIVARGDTEAWRPFAIPLSQPLLWWPHTVGQPALYALALHLTAEGEPCDEQEHWVGIRDLRREDRDPTSLAPVHRYVVNGRPLFLQGACWGCPPARAGAPPAGAAEEEQLLDLARLAHLNALRVEAGSPLPDDAFYDACDRHGILVLQDLPFAGGPYPEGDAAFLQTVRAETESLVRRLRNHPCLAAWCGGDGVPAAGSVLLERILPEIVSRLDPGRPWQPASPWDPAPGAGGPNWPLRGDWQDTTATHATPWASVPAFASAVGRVSAPALRTLRSALSEDDLWPAGHDAAPRAPGQVAWPPAWARLAPPGAWDAVGPLERYPEPASPADLVRILGTAQADYLAERIARQRRGQPDGQVADGRRSWGCLVRRLADAWPTVGPGLVDSDLVPKIAWYAVRRACAPLLLTFEHTADEISLWMVNDSAEPVRGLLTLRALGFDGALRGRMAQEVDMAPGWARRRLSATSFGPLPLADTILAATLEAPPAGMLAQATHLLAPERRLHLPAATLALRVEGGMLIVSSDCFARQVALEGDGDVLLADNYLDLLPGEERRIAILDAGGSRTLTARALNAPPLSVPLGAASA